MKILLILLVLLALSATAFAFKPKQKMTLPLNARAGDLTLESCKYKTKIATYRADCGTLIVPENNLSPTSRLLALPVKRIHAQGVSPREPIVYLGGGPGMSNMGFEPPDELLANHDVLMIGYRGVDGSSMLDCPEYSKATLGDGNDVFSEESLAMMTDAIRSCRARLESEGVDLSRYTMQAVIEDIEAARVALGYEKINLLSESYGTRVAQVYAALHPQALNRSAMIGVNPPGRFVWEPEMVDVQIEQYSRLWEKDDVARARTGNLVETMRNISHNMPRRWLFLPIDPGKVNSMAFVLFFSRKTTSLVFDAYVAAEDGDASGLALMNMAYDLFVPKSFVWGDFFAKGGSADLDPKRDYAATLRATDSIIGSPISLMVWAPLSRAWSQDKLPSGSNEVHAIEVETLLISGSIDFSTPAEYAKDELLPSLRKGKQVIIAEASHVGDVWDVQPEATKRLLTSFYDTGIADDSLYQYVPMNFKVKLGFPMLAKILLGTGVLLVTGLMLGVRRWIHARQ
ncbi:MAG TPA: alpha/beta fold hydrolase [Anaerolineales bacterium]|nr:alpha/beta fold hydrolase [Anaerolineales bacterium]